MTNADETPPSGGYEAPPIEQSEPPAYLPPPAYDYPPPPAAYPPPPAAYPPPPAGYLPPPVYPPPYGSVGGYPQAAPPYPGYGGYPGYAGGYASSRTNQLAIWSLVTSIIGVPLYAFCFIGFAPAIAGIALGIAALNQIKTSGEQGRGLAIAGIAVGGVSLLLAAVVWALIFSV